jgi:type I restriction enzyme, S subunit
MIVKNELIAWDVVDLSSVCYFQGGYAFQSGEYKEEGIPLIRISNLDEESVLINSNTVFVDKKYVSEKKDFLLEKGDVLIAMSGATTGKFAEYNLDSPALLNQRVGRIKLKGDKLDKRYFYFFMHKIQASILNGAYGAAIPNISPKDIAKFKIPLPPNLIQKQIADTLDKADDLRRKDKMLLSKYDELAQSIFYEMFGDPVKNERGWKTMKLLDVCSYITDGTHFSPPNVESGIMYITAKHIKPYRIDFNSNPTYVSLEEHQKIYSRCNPKRGDVLYIKDGATTGIAAINDYDCEFSMLSSLALIRPNSLVNNYYLLYWLNNSAVKRKYLSEYMSGAAIQRYTLVKIKNFKLLVPDIETQNFFREKIVALEKQVSLITKSIRESDNLFHCLITNYFT